jgi:uncharacterized membrane protein YfcA
MDYVRVIKIVLLGAIIGFVAGVQGVAGTLYIITGLLVTGIVKSQKVAAGTALLYTSIPLTFGAFYTYYSRGEFDLHVSLILLPTLFCFSVLGAYFNPMIPKYLVSYSIVCVAISIAGYFLHKGYKEQTK